MPGFGASQLELALEIGEGDIDVAHSHGRIEVAEQLHQDGEADARAKHLCGVGMPELMRDDICGESERVTDLMQVIAELNQDSYFASGTGQKPSIGRQRIQRAEEAQAMYKITDEGIDGDHAFGLEFAKGDMNRPLVWPSGVQTVIGEINAFANTHASVAEQEEDISAEIVAAPEALLEELILLGGKRSWQSVGRAWDILAQQEVSEFSAMGGASQLMEDGAQSKEPADASRGCQRRILGAQVRHPSEDMGISAQLFETSNLRICGAKIDEEVAYHHVVTTRAAGGEGGAQRLDSMRKSWHEGMLEGRTAPALHEEILG